MRYMTKLEEHVRNSSIGKVLPFESENVFFQCITFEQVRHFLLWHLYIPINGNILGMESRRVFFPLCNLLGAKRFLTVLALLNTSLGWCVISLGLLQRIPQCLRIVFLKAQCLLYLVMNIGPLWMEDESIGFTFWLYPQDRALQNIYEDNFWKAWLRSSSKLPFSENLFVKTWSCTVLF